MLKAVIFDFDGVIADSENMHYQAFKETFQKHGFDFPRQDYWAEFLGFSDIELFQEAVAKYGLDLEATPEDMMNQKALIFDRLARTSSSVYPGVVDFVQSLLAAGKRCGIYSGAIMPDIEAVFEIEKGCSGVDMAALFETIVTAEQVSRGKPDPEGYLLAAKRLNDLGEPLDSSECLAIEDSTWGLMAARAAGMKTLAVTNTYPAEQLRGYADMITERLAKDIIPELDNLFS